MLSWLMLFLLWVVCSVGGVSVTQGCLLLLVEILLNLDGVRATRSNTPSSLNQRRSSPGFDMPLGHAGVWFPDNDANHIPADQFLVDEGATVAANHGGNRTNLSLFQFGNWAR